jgi:thiol-disulfide isomerase/thioredoxin
VSGGSGLDHRGRRRLVSALAVVALLAGCGGSPVSRVAPGPAQVDVDTPELRALRSQAGIEPCAAGRGGAVDGGLPAVSLPCLGGGEDVDLSTLRGPMVVNLWASWCGPCRKEMPLLQAFSQEYAGRVSVLGIDYQDVQPGAALELARDTGVTYPLLADPQAELDGAEPFPTLRGLPFLALVDADGVVVHREYVALTSQAQLEDLVAEHLGVSS